jgi:hypothetical protein
MYLAPMYLGSDCSLVLCQYLTPRHPGWTLDRPVPARWRAGHYTGAEAEAWCLLTYMLTRLSFSLSLYLAG